MRWNWSNKNWFNQSLFLQFAQKKPNLKVDKSWNHYLLKDIYGVKYDHEASHISEETLF